MAKREDEISIPIHIFGCAVCKVLLIEPVSAKKSRCPHCHHTIDVFSSYDQICVSTELKLSSTGFIDTYE